MALQPIPLTAESYQLASIPAAQHRLLNLYPEILPDNARAKYYLKATPGLSQLGTFGAGPIHALSTISGRIFSISGTRAFVSSSPIAGVVTPVDLGDVGNVSSGLNHHSIAVGLTEIVFVVPPRAYTCTVYGSNVNQITPGGTFPSLGVSSCCYLDGYYIFTSLNGDFFFTSDLLNARSFSGQSTVKLSSQVDFVEHCAVHNGELWLFGQNSVSAWYNTGDAFTPFSPRTGGVIQGGCGSFRSVRVLDGSLWWLGMDGVVYRTAGYQAKRVSTHAIEELMSGYSLVQMRAIRGFTFTHEGHDFYALTIPFIGRTFIYDCTTGMWHERSSSELGTGPWDISAAAPWLTRSVLGDSVNGRLWTLERGDIYEKTILVRRVAQLPALVTHGPRAFMSRLEIEMQTGMVSPSTAIGVSWSDDGGNNYTEPRQISTGSPGQVRKRVVATRLGSFRQRVLRLTGAGPLMIYGVDADVGTGDS